VEKRTATALVVHCVGTRLAETLRTARHQREPCVTRCHETPRRSQLRRLTQSMSYQRRHLCLLYAINGGGVHCGKGLTTVPCDTVRDAISANLVREQHSSNRESIHCLDVYTRSLFMSIVHRPSETLSF